MMNLPTTTTVAVSMLSQGCTDATACNFDADATDDDGSCTYADAGYDCDGNCLADALTATVYAMSSK